MPPKSFYVPSCIHPTLSTYIAAKPLQLQSSWKFYWSEFLCIGNFISEWTVQPLFNNVAVIPDEASASAFSLWERIVAKIN